MRRLAKRSPAIEKKTLSREEARERLTQRGQDYRVEGLDLIPEGEEITLYFHGEGDKRWGDLCEGPHIDSFEGSEFHFKLQHVAGAYWRGDENNPMMQRI